MLFCNAINLQIFQIRQIFKSEFFGRAPRNTRVGLSARHPQSHHPKGFGVSSAEQGWWLCG